jgi:hypothetical protein
MGPCGANISICPAIDPIDVEHIGDIIQVLGVKDIYGLANKMDTPKAKALLARIPAARRKTIMLMLNRIKSEK